MGDAMQRNIKILVAIFSILIPYGSAFGVCIFGGGSSHTEGRIVIKNQTFKDETSFSTELNDSSGNVVSDVEYEMSANLLEYQSICRRNDQWWGYGFAITGAIPLLVKEPNASFETSNSKTNFKDVLINYYGGSAVLDANLGGGIPRSNLQLGLTVTGKAGWEFVTGRYDYTYDGSNKQTDEMKNYNSPFLEFFFGLKLNVFDDNKNIKSILVGTNQHISSAEVATNYELGYSWIW